MFSVPGFIITQDKASETSRSFRRELLDYKMAAAMINQLYGFMATEIKWWGARQGIWL